MTYIIARLPVVPIVTSALLPSRGWVRGSVRKNFVPPFIIKWLALSPVNPVTIPRRLGLVRLCSGPNPNPNPNRTMWKRREGVIF